MSRWLQRGTALGIWILVVVSAVPWRQGVYYEGGLDQVVLAKAALQALALLGAAAWCLAVPGRPVPAAPVLVLLLFTAVSLLGAGQAGQLVPAAVLAVRLLLAALTAVLVMRAAAPADALGTLLAAMAAVGLTAAAGGIGELLAGGRLEGGVLPLSPNLIALLAGAPALACLHLAVRGRFLGWAVPAVLLLGAVVVATGSRTGIAVMAVAALLNLLYLGRLKRVLVALFLAGIPVAVAAAFFTPMVTALLMRPDSASLLTLNSRTIAWEAVLATPPGTWTWWVGEGLSVKTVPVEGQYWDEQVLDSSWMSALAQAGIVGTAVLGVWVLATVVLALANRGLPGGLPVTLLAFVVGRSLLENGLTEASAAFLLFFVLSMIVSGPRPDRPAPGQPSLQVPPTQAGHDAARNAAREAAARSRVAARTGPLTTAGVRPAEQAATGGGARRGAAARPGAARAPHGQRASASGPDADLTKAPK